MRWKSDKVRTTVLKARETDVQECNSVKSTCNSTDREKERERNELDKSS